MLCDNSGQQHSCILATIIIINLVWTTRIRASRTSFRGQFVFSQTVPYWTCSCLHWYCKAFSHYQWSEEVDPDSGTSAVKRKSSILRKWSNHTETLWVSRRKIRKVTHIFKTKEHTTQCWCSSHCQSLHYTYSLFQWQLTSVPPIGKKSSTSKCCLLDMNVYLCCRCGLGGKKKNAPGE